MTSSAVEFFGMSIAVCLTASTLLCSSLVLSSASL